LGAGVNDRIGDRDTPEPPNPPTPTKRRKIINIIKQDPPAQRRTGKYDDIADQLANDMGSWYRIATGLSSGSLAAGINNGKVGAFQPKGAFEAVSRTQDDGVAVWARYVGELAAEPARELHEG
jgi:hypothetical protein